MKLKSDAVAMTSAEKKQMVSAVRAQSPGVQITGNYDYVCGAKLGGNVKDVTFNVPDGAKTCIIDADGSAVVFAMDRAVGRVRDKPNDGGQAPRVAGPGTLGAVILCQGSKTISLSLAYHGSAAVVSVAFSF